MQTATAVQAACSLLFCLIAMGGVLVRASFALAAKYRTPERAEPDSSEARGAAAAAGMGMVVVGVSMTVILWLSPVADVSSGTGWDIARVLMVSVGALLVHARAHASILKISYRRAFFMSVFQFAFVATTILTIWGVGRAYMGP